MNIWEPPALRHSGLFCSARGLPLVAPCQIRNHVPARSDPPMVCHRDRDRALDVSRRGLNLPHVLLRAFKGIVADVNPAAKRAVEIGDRQHAECDEQSKRRHLECM
jgi:hypothetical protein